MVLFCFRTLTAEKVTSLGKDWHRPCLKCEKCNKTLTSGGHAEHDGKPYCNQPCYSALFGPKGGNDPILILLQDLAGAVPRVTHSSKPQGPPPVHCLPEANGLQLGGKEQVVTALQLLDLEMLDRVLYENEPCQVKGL
ncbi:hypothetical protein KIL84_015648 [Mauremys mutica]|uniref:LIM zinc-binding domain-containing protein n=1 Tax=Mauremys mutica TaxID=74926 RepID=A0A9D3WR67_9SAUR|nr:hypothetical protein KIL84_015648 [Mauremys mutica]